MLNALDFGTLGDGAAIQAALNALPAGSTYQGDAVYVPAGVWLCDQPLVIPAGVFNSRLFGDGFSTQIVKHAASSSPLLTFATGYTERFEVDHLSLNSEGFGGDALLIQNVRGARIHDLCVENYGSGGGSGITAQGGNNGTTPLSDTQIWNVFCNSAIAGGWAAINIKTTARDVSIHGVRSDGGFVTRKALAVSQTSDLQVSNVHMFNVAENALYIDGAVDGPSDFSLCIFEESLKEVVYIDGSAHPVSVPIRFTACQFNFPAPGFLPLAMNAAAQWVTFGDRQIIAGSTIGTVPAATTAYLGPNGRQTVENDNLTQVMQEGAVIAVTVAVDTAPGAGKSFSYTLRKNGADTGISGAISGGAFQTTLTGNVSVAPSDRLAIKLVTGSGAAAARHRWNYAAEVIVSA